MRKRTEVARSKPAKRGLGEGPLALQRREREQGEGGRLHKGHKTLLPEQALHRSQDRLRSAGSPPHPVPSPPRGGEGTLTDAASRLRRKQARKTIANTRNLRGNQTDSERMLWHVLRNRGLGGLKFVRQRPVGRFIADFLCAECKLIVELDGSQHNGAGLAKDARRTQVLESYGYRVIRFWNFEVHQNLVGVLESILVAAFDLRVERRS